MVLADAGTEVTLCARRPEVAAAIAASHLNPGYLPGVTLPTDLHATADVADAVHGVDVVVLAMPAQSLRDRLVAWSEVLPRDALYVSLIKGIELGTGRRMTEVVGEVLDLPRDRLAVVAGPNLAAEIAARQIAAAVVACSDPDVALWLQKLCHTPYFRPYTGGDVVGCELGGAVKNVIALAVGIAVGMGLGDNTKATLITRGLAETARLGQALGADRQTISGLAGLGDLVATCSSPLSRNRTFGERLGRGEPLADVLAATTQTAEGVKSSQSVAELARAHRVEMPMTEVVAAVMHDGLSIGDAALRLLSRSAKPEHY